MMFRFKQFSRSSYMVVTASAALAFWAPSLLAQGKAANSHDGNAPVNYAADRIELQDKAKRVLLSGNVDITQDTLRLRSARALVLYIDDGGIKIQRMDASGGVNVVRGNESATSDLATYDFNRRIITMIGHVTLHRGNDVSNAERMVIDLDNHQSTLASSAKPGAGDGSGRVFGRFDVPKKK